MAHPTSFFPESRPPTVHVVYLTRWSGCFQAPIPWTFPRFTAPRPMRVLKMWMRGSFFCSKQKNQSTWPRQFDDLLDLLDDLIIIIQEASFPIMDLYAEWLGHLIPEGLASETCLDAWSWAWSRETEGRTSGRKPSGDTYLFNKN